MKRIATNLFQDEFKNLFLKGNEQTQSGESNGPIFLSWDELRQFATGMNVYICKAKQKIVIVMRPAKENGSQSLVKTDSFSSAEAVMPADSYLISIDPNPDLCPPNC